MLEKEVIKTESFAPAFLDALGSVCNENRIAVWLPDLYDSISTGRNEVHYFCAVKTPVAGLLAYLFIQRITFSISRNVNNAIKNFFFNADLV